jgi:hypothetical protein
VTGKKRYVVQQPRKSPYSRPIALAKGEIVSVGEEYRGEEPWEGWIWCEKDATKCWVPFQIVERTTSGTGVVREDYVATELDVERGEVVEAERELNGWVWASKIGTTHCGWVPLDILAEDPF